MLARLDNVHLRQHGRPRAQAHLPAVPASFPDSASKRVDRDSSGADEQPLRRTHRRAETRHPFGPAVGHKWLPSLRDRFDSNLARQCSGRANLQERITLFEMARLATTSFISHIGHSASQTMTSRRGDPITTIQTLANRSQPLTAIHASQGGSGRQSKSLSPRIYIMGLASSTLRSSSLSGTPNIRL
jgi:hypothetical protein